MNINNFNYSFNLKIKRIQNYNLIFKYTDPNNNNNLSFPISIDLSNKLDFIYNQKNLGSCTSNSVAWLYKYYRINFNPSRLFIYYYTRLFDQMQGDNSVKIDDGSTLLQTMNVIKKKGVVSEKIYPYIIKRFKNKPPNFLNKFAFKNRINNFVKVNQDIESIKFILNSGNPFVFGILVFSSFLNSTTF